MKNELVGFGKPNDLAHVVARVEFSKGYGLFGRLPVWGGMRLHELYPPASTVLVRALGMVNSLNLFFALNLIVWAYFTNIWTALLFTFSYFTFGSLLYTGRFPEWLGYLMVTLAFFTPFPGIFLGLAGLFHPLALVFGSVILLTKFNILTYIIAFCVCGWWYVPFLLKMRKFSYLKEKRKDKIFGIYFTSLAMMGNLILFMFFPQFAPFSLIGWLWGVKYIRSKPYYISDLKGDLPFLDKIKDFNVAIVQKGKELLTVGSYAWASAAYLLKDYIIVYNGLPATDARVNSTIIPKSIKTYEVNK